MRTLKEMLSSIDLLKKTLNTETSNRKTFKKSIFGWLDKGVDRALNLGLKKAYSQAAKRGNSYVFNATVLYETFGLSGLIQKKRDELVKLLLEMQVSGEKVFYHSNGVVSTTYNLDEVLKIIYEENLISADS